MTSISSLPEWLVRRSSDLLGGTRSSRRGFLAGSAVVGSALATAPRKFVFTPVSAYDSVCGTDTACADGYSVFCCTINNNGNFCPEGSFLGGWWKADDSGFCCGGPRYYLDCNASCGSGWTCSCEDSPYTCDNRRIACNQFRYGQCNLDIACYGPVVCRMVTCTAPWEFDGSCNATSATDDNTVSHSAPCLPGDCPSPLTMRYYDLGGPGGFLGPPVNSEQGAPAGGGTWEQFQNGALYDVTPAGLHFVVGAIWDKFASLGGPVGFLGYPTTDQAGTPDGVGAYNAFANDGYIYTTPQLGPWSIHGPIRDKWASLGWEQSFLGYPVSDQTPTPDGLGQFNHFTKLVNGQQIDHGSIYWTDKTGAWSIHGPIRDKWGSLGWEEGVLGYPITDQAPTRDGLGQCNQFTKLTHAGVVDHGSIYWTWAFGPWSIYGRIRHKWTTMGRELSVLGYPVTDTLPTPDGIGQFNHFSKLTNHGITDNGAIYSSLVTGVWSVHGHIWKKWSQLGWESGVVGYPVSDQTKTSDGRGRYNLFAKVENGQIAYNGSIFWTAEHGAHPVYGPIYTMWTARGRESGSLGYPVKDPRSVTQGSGSVTYQEFEHGFIYAPSDGSAYVVS